MIFKTYEDSDCPMKKFIKLFYDSIFIENLDLSGNLLLHEVFAEYFINHI